jgi:hypothetical protein
MTAIVSTHTHICHDQKDSDLGEKTVPYLDQKGSYSVEDALCPQFEEARRYNISLYAVKKLSDQKLGAGKSGIVYRAEAPDRTPIVYKIEKEFIKRRPHWGTNMVRQDNKEMINGSFQFALTCAKAHRNLPKSTHFPNFRGIVYLEELNIFGRAYDFIPGSNLDESIVQSKHPLSMLISLCEALKILDESGYAYHDLIRENVILREDSTAVLFDDIATKSPVHLPNRSMESRRKFGHFIFSFLSPSGSHEREDLVKELGSSLGGIIADCVENKKSMKECSWDHIESVLKSAKEFLGKPAPEACTLTQDSSLPAGSTLNSVESERSLTAGTGSTLNSVESERSRSS